MSRAAWLAIATLLLLPVLSAAWTVASSTAFLVEFLSGGRWPALADITPKPEVRPLPLAAFGWPGTADLYVRGALGRPTGLVLVQGITPKGKDDPQIRSAAMLLARAGWAVAVPTIDGLTVLRLRPEDAAPVAAAALALRDAGYRPVALLAVSLGAAPALAAAGQPAVAADVSAVLALGGYASARELLRYTLTGAYAFAGTSGRRAVDERGIAQFAAANRDLVEADGRALVDNRDPAAVDALIAALPARTRELLDALSPERAIHQIRAPLFLVHGREDATVPFTESMRLERAAAAAGVPARATIVGTVGHVDPAERITAGELWQTWATFYAFRVASAGSSGRAR